MLIESLSILIPSFLIPFRSICQMLKKLNGNVHVGEEEMGGRFSFNPLEQINSYLISNPFLSLIFISLVEDNYCGL